MEIEKVQESFLLIAKIGDFELLKVVENDQQNTMEQSNTLKG